MWSTGALTAALAIFARCSLAQQLVVQGNAGLAHVSVALHSDKSVTVDDVPSDSFADTIVSALSQSDQHTTLIRLLQRSKCIPLLAHIGNATVFAPTDKAWKAWEDDHRPSSEDPTGLYRGWLSARGLEEWTWSEDQVLAARIESGGERAEEEKKLDNQNWWLRQHLLYHMLNYTLPPSAFFHDSPGDKGAISMTDAAVSLETTLLFPLTEEPPLPPTPPPGPPWLPRGGEGLLGGHGQRLRVAKGDSEHRAKVGVDWTGSGGIEFWDGSGWPVPDDQNKTSVNEAQKRKGDKGDQEGNAPKKPSNATGPVARWVRNGVVVGIQGVLEPPLSIQEIIQSTPELSYLSHLLPSSPPFPDPLPDDLATAPHLTIFAPSNEAFKGAFDDIERGYLEGGYGSEGIGRVIGGSVVLAVGRGQVGWSDAFKANDDSVEAAFGLHLMVEASQGLAVNGTNASAIDIFASNGVIHILPTLLLPANFSLLNSAEKVLLSVNATRFVSLLRDANLSSKYVGQPGREQDESQAWTFLAPTDDVMDMMDRFGADLGPPLPHVWQHVKRDQVVTPNHRSVQLADEPFKDASPLAALLQYHILPGRYDPSDIKDGMLLGTELRTSSLKGERQRLRVDISSNRGKLQWDTVGQGEIRFGGASVRGKPVRSGKSIIYLISSLLSPPEDVLQTAVSDLQLSTFIAAVYAADMERIVKHTPGLTWFLPRNRACSALGLGMQYLLSSEGKDELRKVLRYHAIDGVIYSADIESGKSVYKTIEGGDIILDRSSGKNGNLSLSSPTKWKDHDSGEAFPANGELRPARISQLDALTSTGVVHTIDSLEMPADVSLTIAKLIRGSKQNTMMDLMIRAGMEWILQGREPTNEEVNAAQLHGVVQTWSSDGENDGDEADSLAMPSYTVLCPSDKAFSRINMSLYLSDKDALLDLLKLHIIPTQPSTPRTMKTKQPAEPPKDGQPLSLLDDLVYDTLYSSKSKYGQLAFRATGDNSYMIGIRNARSSSESDNNAARVGASGRGSVRWRRNRVPDLWMDDTASRYKRWLSSNKDKKKTSEAEEDDKRFDLWKGGLALGGGVLMIDNVLVPFEPSWFSRWGWLIVSLVVVGVVLLVAGATFVWWRISKNKEEKYEPLEGEEEE
ncbi:hypothetical protein BD324DRAFT_617870 [Kockovaella imperatae]|uniref:FAS1 domain-containing protein n=1 Tax=Kockovaella imperatae TaxID=4999 RepID=A0A1Y1UN83_9TREE|nr:hypothetical protein BD324DRAFT_617870 [Kockovaella imperatae]ORX38916.1 hypothetical protein BD324DRAFT_617870 [Kockovaella imperatae]